MKRQRLALFTVFSLLGTVLSASLASSQSFRTSPATPINSGICHESIANDVNRAVAISVQANKIPGLTVSVSKDGRMVCNKAFGYSDWEAKTPMTTYSRSQIGSVTKVLVTAGMMKLVEQDKVSLTTPVYGQDGILKENAYREAMRQGARRHRPIVGIAIGRNNRVSTWYFDGTVTQGSSSDLDQYIEPRAYSLPPRQSPDTIRAIARGGPQNRVYTWYDDGSVSIGTATDLDAHSYQRNEGEDGEFKGYRVANGARRNEIVGIGMDTEQEITYTWYHDGRVSSGSVTNFASRWTEDYQTPGSQNRRYDIVDVAVSSNDVNVAWYSDAKASKGSAQDLGSVRGLYD